MSNPSTNSSAGNEVLARVAIVDGEPPVHQIWLAQLFLVDFLGSLVPGTFFTLALAVMAWIFSWAFAAPSPLHTTLAAELAAFKDTPTSLLVTVILIAIGLAYSIGQIFSRSDPKAPDRLSYVRNQWRLRWRMMYEARHCPELLKGWRYDESRGKLTHEIKPADPSDFQEALKLHYGGLKGAFRVFRARLAEWFRRKDIYDKEKYHPKVKIGKFSYHLSRKDKGEEYEDFQMRCRVEFACGDWLHCEFPYPYMKEFLIARGFEELTTLLPDKKRSKHHINSLKIELRFLNPAHCEDLIKNEAHIRLSSAGWYVVTTLKWVALALVFSLCAIQLAWHGLEGLNASLPSIFWLSGIGMACGILRRSIERYFHYQRLREVFFVLKTYHIAKEGGYRVQGGAQQIPSPPVGAT